MVTDAALMLFAELGEPYAGSPDPRRAGNRLRSTRYRVGHERLQRAQSKLTELVLDLHRFILNSR